MKFKRIIILLLAMALLLQLCGAAVFAEGDGTEADEYWTEIIESIIDESGIWRGYVAVALYFPETGESVYYNADKWFDHASLFKLPLCMKLENMALHGEELTDRIDEELGLEKAVEECLVNSNNTYANALLDYYGFESFYDYVSSLYEGEPISRAEKYNRRFTARIMLDVLKELYNNRDEYPNIIDYMKQAQPGMYLRRYQLPEGVEVAQKYGGWNALCHIAGIIYADQPVLVVIMTREMTSAGSNNMIGRFAVTLCDICSK